MFPARAIPRLRSSLSRFPPRRRRWKRPKSLTMPVPSSLANWEQRPSRRTNSAPVSKMTGSPNESWPAVFLDGDGTLMRDVDYCGDAGEVQVYSATAQALRRLREHGYKLALIA